MPSAIGGFLLPERPTDACQLLNDAPPFTNAKHAKQAKEGGWTIRCPCECEVCKQNARKISRWRRHFFLCVHDVIRWLLACACELGAFFARLLIIVILFALPRSRFLYRRRGPFGRLTAMCCTVRNCDWALLWGAMAPQTPPAACPVASTFLLESGVRRAALGMSLPHRRLSHLRRLQTWLSMCRLTGARGVGCAVS